VSKIHSDILKKNAGKKAVSPPHHKGGCLSLSKLNGIHPVGIAGRRRREKADEGIGRQIKRGADVMPPKAKGRSVRWDLIHHRAMNEGFTPQYSDIQGTA